METTDSELVARALDGDDQAIAALYDRYADRLYGFCYSMLRDREEAADAIRLAIDVARDHGSRHLEARAKETRASLGLE